MACNKEVRIITFNINSIAKSEKLSKIVRESFSNTRSKTLLCIQVCKVGQLKTEHQQTLDFYKLEHIFSPAVNTAGCLIIIFERGQPFKILDQDENHQIISANDGKLTVVNFSAEPKILKNV